jgi:hypothetical protein
VKRRPSVPVRSRCGAVHRGDWPAWLRHPAVSGLCVGGCIARGPGLGPSAKVHSHVAGAFGGWICFRKVGRLADKMLGLHELAHIVSGDRLHTPKWRAVVLRLGGTLDATESMRSYRRRLAA